MRKRTPPSTSAPNPPKKASELRSASATARCRITAGSITGLGWRKERSTSQAPETAGQRERSDDPRRWSSPSPSPRRWRRRGWPPTIAEERCAQQVRLVGLGVTDLAEEPNTEEKRQQAEREVDQEHPAPARPGRAGPRSAARARLPRRRRPTTGRSPRPCARARRPGAAGRAKSAASSAPPTACSTRRRRGSRGRGRWRTARTRW